MSPNVQNMSVPFSKSLFYLFLLKLKLSATVDNLKCVITNQFGNGLIVIMPLPLLSPPPPSGRGRTWEGEDIGEGGFLSSSTLPFPSKSSPSLFIGGGGNSLPSSPSLSSK